MKISSIHVDVCVQGLNFAPVIPLLDPDNVNLVFSSSFGLCHSYISEEIAEILGDM